MTRPGSRRVVLAAVVMTGLVLGGAWLFAQGRDALVAEGRQLFADEGCLDCHTAGAAGTPIAPDLRRAASRYPEATLARWLRDPAAQEPTRHMPDLRLTEAEASALAAYLASLR
jgi:mono/diheme cytochrome c family protein